jgi:hypothetical protein
MDNQAPISLHLLFLGLDCQSLEQYTTTQKKDSEAWRSSAMANDLLLN